MILIKEMSLMFNSTFIRQITVSKFDNSKKQMPKIGKIGIKIKVSVSRQTKLLQIVCDVY